MFICMYFTYDADLTSATIIMSAQQRSQRSLQQHPTASRAAKTRKLFFCVAFFFFFSFFSGNYFQCVHIECTCASNEKKKKPHTHSHSAVKHLVDFMLNSSKFVKKYQTTVGTPLTALDISTIHLPRFFSATSFFPVWYEVCCMRWSVLPLFYSPPVLFFSLDSNVYLFLLLFFILFRLDNVVSSLIRYIRWWVFPASNLQATWCSLRATTHHPIARCRMVDTEIENRFAQTLTWRLAWPKPFN